MPRLPAFESTTAYKPWIADEAWDKARCTCPPGLGPHVHDGLRMWLDEAHYLTGARQEAK